MRLRRAVVAAVAAWMAVVLVGATVVWAVISNAGEELASSSAQPGATTSPTPAPSTIGPDRPIEKRPRPTRSASPTADPSPSVTPSPTPTPTVSTSKPSTTKHTPPASSPPPQAWGSQVQTDSWAERPGTITLSCKGDSRVKPSSVYANPGWKAETEWKAAGVEVHFHAVRGDDEVEVSGACVRGRPVFHSGRDHEDD
jgi:hypothetical protein